MQPRLIVFSLSIVGLLIGLALSFLGFGAAGAGHGAYVLIGLVSSPLGIVGDVLLALFGVPILWTLFGYFAANADRPDDRRTFLIMMTLHFSTLYPILSDHKHFGDWSRVSRVRQLLMVGFAAYGCAQLLLWGVFLYQWMRSRKK
jgi:hypothetical protein